MCSCVIMVSARGRLKGTNRQHSGQMSQNIQTEKPLDIQPVRPTEVCGKV